MIKIKAKTIINRSFNHKLHNGKEVYMSLSTNLLKNEEYLSIVRKIERMHFITDGKWDWEHGLGHYKRVSEYTKEILSQLQVDDRTIELAMFASLLHDIGLSKGEKIDHATESVKLSRKFIENVQVTETEKEILYQAIGDHSSGTHIASFVGLSLLLADKLDVTYHRTENSTIQDKINTEIQKIKKVRIQITDTELIVIYNTENDFDISILKEWKKMVTIPKKVAEYLNLQYKFILNGKEVEYDSILMFPGYQKKVEMRI